MMMSQLPDGSWATSPVYCGPGLPHRCPDEFHEWRDLPETRQEVPDPDEKRFRFMTMQRCEACGWQRAHMTKE